MTTVKVIWIFVVIVGSITTFLAWENRASEKVATNLPTALAVSVVGALVTLLFTLQPEQRTQSFAVEYVIDPRTGIPFGCGFVPESTSYTDAGGGTVFPAWKEGQPLLPAVLESLQKGDDASLIRLYRRTLIRQMLQMLRFTFLKSWDADPSRFILPTGDGTTTYAAKTVRPGRQLTDAEMVEAFDGDRFVASSDLPGLKLPPATKLHVRTTDEATEITASNSFVTVTINLTDRGVAHGLGLLRELCHLPWDGSELFRRPRYAIKLSAEFNAIRVGHPDMPTYRHWVDIIFGELALFDSQRRWEAFKEQYVLVYSRRTKTPLEEMMAETIKKAEGTEPGKAR